MKLRILPTSLKVAVVCAMLSPFAFADTSENYEKALAAFNNESFSESYIHLKNALQESPTHLPSKLLMGRVLLIDGYVNDAITEFEEVKAAGADLNLVLVPLANAYLISRDFDSLIALPVPRNLSASTKLDVILLKATAHIQQGDLDLAEILYKNAEIEFKDDIRIINGLAQISLLNKNYAEANNHLDLALNEHNNNPQSLFLRGLVLQSQDKSDAAREQFELAYQYDDFDPAIKRALANSYVEANMLPEAELMIAQIEKQTQGDLQTQLLKARLLAMQAKNDEADAVLAALSQTLSLATDQNKQQTTWLSLVSGITAYINKNYEVTVRELSRYVKTGSAPPELLGMLAEAHVRQGAPKKAMEVLELNESVVLKSIPVSSLLCDLYLASNKVFKCNSIVEELKKNNGNNHAVILLEAKLLVRRDKVDQALTLLSDSNLDTNAEDVLLFKATLEADEERFDAAIQSTKKLVALQPENINYANLNADLHIRSGDMVKDETLLKEILANDPNSIGGLLNLTRVQFAQKKLDMARASIEKVIALEPTNLAALMLDAQILVTLNENEAAIERLLTAKALAPNDPSPHELLANIYRQQKDYAVALNEVNALLKGNRFNSAYIFEKANLLIALNEPEKAKTQMDILFGQWSDDAKRLVELSRSQLQAKDTKAARISLERAADIAPNYALAKLEYGQLLLSQKKLSDVKILLTDMQKTFPNNPNVFLLQGHYFKAQGDIEQAYLAYVHALSLEPEFTLPLIELYQIASHGKYTEEYKQYLVTYLSSHPDAHFQRHLLADLNFIARDFTRAETHYLILVAIDELPNKARIYNNLAIIKIDSDNKQGLDYAEQAAKLAPNSAAILDTKGWLQVKNGQYQDALNTLRLAFTLRSSDPSIRYHLAVVLTELGQNSQAKTELEQALASVNRFPERQEAQALLQTL